MHCINCSAEDTKVIETRSLQNGQSIRRRRKCEKCSHRFTTYEQVNLELPLIVKNDGRRETFNSEKIKKGLRKACQKRPVSENDIESLIDEVSIHLAQKPAKEISSDQVGNLVMEKLERLDPVAFVRFASFYWNFDNVDSFVQNLQDTLKFRNHTIDKGTLSERTH